MAIPTTSELALLRERPQSVQLYMSIYQPNTVLGARVATGTHYPGDTGIVYDTVSTGSYSQVADGMTMLIGTSAGDFDKGKIRVKYANATGIYVAPNMDINWQNGDYLTILAFHEVWSKYAKISPDLDADDDIIILKDGDTYYSNQNNIMGSLMVMGGNYAGFVENPVYYSASGTVNVLGGINSYLWAFEGGTPTGSIALEPGNVVYSTPGHYTTTLRVSNSSGTATDYGYRHVSIYNRSTKQPIRQWGIDSFSGSREQGGYSVDVWVRDTLSPLLEGSLVTIFSESVYGQTSIEIGGNSKNRSSIVFSGYVVEGSVQYDYQTSSTTFTIASTTDVMKRRDGLSISVDSVVTPSKWQQLPNLDMRKAIYHYLKWHSTVTEVTDIRYSGTLNPVQYLETDMESLYDGLQSYIENRVDGLIVSDRQNNLYIESGIRLTHGATGTYPVQASLRNQDWVGEPEIEFVATNPVSYVDLGGFAYSGPATGTSTTLLADAPGSLKSYTGTPESGPQGLILLNQAELSQQVGDYYAYQNARFPNVSLQLSSSFLTMDIAPYEQVLLNVLAADTNRGFVFMNKPFHISELTWEYDPVGMTFLPEVALHEITQGFSGQPIAVPVPVIPSYPDDPYIPPYLPPYDPIVVPEIPEYVPPEVPEEVACRVGTVPTGPYSLWFGNAPLLATTTGSVGNVAYALLPHWMRPETAIQPTYLTFKGLFETWENTAIFPFTSHTIVTDNNNPLVIRAESSLNVGIYPSTYTWLQTPSDHAGIGIMRVDYTPGAAGMDLAWYKASVANPSEMIRFDHDLEGFVPRSVLNASTLTRDPTEGLGSAHAYLSYEPSAYESSWKKPVAISLKAGDKISCWIKRTRGTYVPLLGAMFGVKFSNGIYYGQGLNDLYWADNYPAWTKLESTIPAGLASYLVTEIIIGYETQYQTWVNVWFDDITIGGISVKYRVTPLDASVYNICARSF